MLESDFDNFSTMLDAVCSLLSRGSYVPNAQNSAMFFRSLMAHDISAVRAGLNAHVADPVRGKFVPVPADVIAQIQANATADGRPGSDEAWAGCVRAADETDTVVWTGEMAAAWEIARPVFDSGDEIGARMAFRDAYGRLVQEARDRGERPAWLVSEGFDAARRALAIERAVTAGRLGSDWLALAAPSQSPMLLLEGAKNAPPHVVEALRALRDKLAGRASMPSVDATEKARTEVLKSETARKVAEYRSGSAS